MEHTKIDPKLLEELEQALGYIKKVFDINHLINATQTTSQIIKYYEKSEKAYHFIHSTKGSIHFPLLLNNQSKPEELAQAYFIEEYIKNINTQKVLELGVGKGFNIKYLASNYPHIKFWGIDITPINIQKAMHATEHLENVFLCRGDFERLPFKQKHFDLIYSIETFCHATNLKSALKGVHYVLKPKGYFIVFDGYRKTNINKLPQNLKTAAILVEKSMAVNQGATINTWVKTAQQVGFKVIVKEDLTYATMQTWEKFQKLASFYFKFPTFAKITTKIFDTLLLQNAIAATLAPLTIKAGVHGYYKVVLQK